MNYNGFDKESVDIFLEQVRLGETEIVEMFIQQDIDIITVKNEFGNSALHFACGNCHVDMVEMLLSHSEVIEIINDVNQQGNTPMHWTVGAPIEMMDGIKEDHIVKITNMLLEKGADKNILNKSEQTPLLIAIQKHRELVVEVLMEPIGDDIEIGDGEIVVEEDKMEEIKEEKEMKEEK